MVVFGDSNMLTDDDHDSDGTDNWEDSDAEIFFLNTIRWLSAAGIEERLVVFDESHTPNFNHDGPFTKFSNLLTENGYNVKWMSTFLPELVEEADVLFIIDGATDYSTSEIAQIVSFVSGGGSLYLTGAWGIYFDQIEPIGNEFGFGAGSDVEIQDTNDTVGPVNYITYTGENIWSHPITQGLSRIELYTSGTIETLGGPRLPILVTDNDASSIYSGGASASNMVVMAATVFDMGRVFYSADYMMLRGDFDGDSDGFYGPYDADNPLLLLNVFHWLTEDRAPIVEVSFPNGGEVLNGTEIITWEAEDWDSDPMTFDVYLSEDSGGNWFILDMGLTNQEYELNTSLYVDLDTYMVRVVAHANGATGEDTSDSNFEIDNLPEPIIPPPTDLTPFVLLAVGGIVVLVIIIFLMKKKGGGGE
jgi:hypothetical protein